MAAHTAGCGGRPRGESQTRRCGSNRQVSLRPTSLPRNIRYAISYASATTSGSATNRITGTHLLPHTIYIHSDRTCIWQNLHRYLANQYKRGWRRWRSGGAKVVPAWPWCCWRSCCWPPPPMQPLLGRCRVSQLEVRKPDAMLCWQKCLTAGYPNTKDFEDLHHMFCYDEPTQ